MNNHMTITYFRSVTVLKAVSEIGRKSLLLFYVMKYSSCVVEGFNSL